MSRETLFGEETFAHSRGKPPLIRSRLARFIAGFGVLVFAAGCANAPANVASGTADVTTGLAKAEQLYGIAKGAALVAEVSNPSLAPAINAAIAKGDAVIATLNAAVPAVSSDVTSDLATLEAQANALLLAAAPAIKVVGS
jgi:hypothetical protein